MHKKKVISEIIIGFLIISSFVIFNEKTEAAAGEFFVDDDFYIVRDGSAEHPFATIQDAINAASEGDTIYVFGGTYEDSFSINKKITLMGSIEDGNSTITYTTDHQYTVKINADYINFTGFDLVDINNNIISQINGAMLYVNADNVIIQNCNFKFCRNGSAIYLDSADNNIIRNNIFDALNNGIYFSSSVLNEIVNNTIVDCNDAGIEMMSSMSNRVYNNYINKCNYGIYLRDCSNTNITKNTITDNGFHGLAIFENSNDKIKNNDIFKNSGSGIYLDSTNTEVKENRISENIVGLTLANDNCKIMDNWINDSISIGIQAAPTSNNNYIYRNLFYNNGINANDNGKNYWYYQMQGNFWDDYLEVDRDFDGIGDVSYSISGGNHDTYPLGIFLKPPVKPYNPSPSDAEDGVGLKIVLSVEVKDPDGDLMDVYFYNAIDDTLLGVDYSISSGDRAVHSFNLGFQTTYAWYVLVKDYKLQNQSDIWFFTTRVRPAGNDPPISIPGGPYSTDTDKAINFNAEDSYDPDGYIDFYRWNFGDGSTEILDGSPTHKYSNPGDYIVTLTVIDNNGTSNENTTTVTVEPSKNEPPIALANGPYSGKVNERVQFSCIGSYDPDPGDSISLYYWDFGDGSNSTDANPTHNYSIANNYQIILTVTDSGGLTNTATTYITVAAAPSDQTSGFELILVIIAIGLAFILYRKRRK